MNYSKIVESNVEMDFLIIPDNTKYWFVRASQKAEFFNDFKINNFIAIGDNEMTLDTLRGIEDKYKASADILKERYKILFNNLYIDLVKKNDEFKKQTKSEQADTLENVKRSSTIASYKAFSFIEEMSIGDYVFVPHKSSNAFLIGIIISDVFDQDIDHEYFGDDYEYPISNYDKKRKIAWLKEISLNELPPKLMWIQNGHKAIFDISNFSDEINPILSNSYQYKDKLHLKIDVATKQDITSTQWLNYQQVIHSNAKENADNLYQKTDVQSPGKIILETAIENWDTIAIIFALLFAEPDIDIKGVKFKNHGPLSFLVPGSKRRRELENRSSEAKIRKEEAETKLVELEVEEKELDLNQKKNNNTIIGVPGILTNSTEVETKAYSSNPIEAPTKEQQISLQQMDIKYKTIGNDITHETQRKILNEENNQS